MEKSCVANLTDNFTALSGGLLQVEPSLDSLSIMYLYDFGIYVGDPIIAIFRCYGSAAEVDFRLPCGQ